MCVGVCVWGGGLVMVSRGPDQDLVFVRSPFLINAPLPFLLQAWLAWQV